MPLEVATFINQLDPSNPAAPDLLADTDNHLRLIKQVIKNTFPNVTGPVTLTQHGLNGAVPIGGIILWSGATNAIPAGWVLCAGQTGISRSDGEGTINVPDLRNRFIVGAGGSYTVGQTGGSQAQTGTTDTQGSHAHSGSTGVAGGHYHGGRTADHRLTIAQMPSHDHSVYHGSVANGGGSALMRASATGSTSASFIENRGGGDPHSHGIGWDGDHAHTFATDYQGAHWHNVNIPDGRPPFYALAYIMRV
ncbi:microcystin-dependent protein [Microvirga flocculans]|uniref:Microcystin-dependent protein n=1 Tax=Microvirga flocculans TaxID=217168 RepID=A0A7W6ICV1_9HYPH|nr:tail fiber protein [Microvirga flocculans]MBB4039095.1 microcystin-dependent protein [Microvirga flocculans]